MKGVDTVQVVLISGFLGAGKTTLMKRLLSAGPDMSDTVVIVNEFGDIGIDGGLLGGDGLEVVELTNGCICCTMKVDLLRTLEAVLERFHPTWVLIESSGVADPRSILGALSLEPVRDRVRLHRSVTVLDADCWEMRHLLGDLFTLQLEAADLVVVNKIDLLPDERVRACLAEIGAAWPDTPVIPAVHGRVDPDVIRSPDPVSGADGNLEAGLACPAPHVPEETASRFVTFSFQTPGVMNEDRFRDVIAGLPLEVFRAKGVVRFADRAGLLNYVGGRADWSEWSGDPSTRLVFVGWDVSGEETLRRLEGCVDGPE